MFSDIISTILKIAFFFILGSLISFFADTAGKKIGKRKIVLFNLRPKHTAVLITSITGGLIAVSSILFLSFLSEDARIYLFQMKKIVEQIDFYKNEVKTLQQRYTELTGDISILIQTTHMGDIVFLKNQPIYIFSYHNDGSKKQLYQAIDKVRNLVIERYKIKNKANVYNLIRINYDSIRQVLVDIEKRRNRRMVLIFSSMRNTFIGEYVDINIYQIEDKIIFPANTVLEEVEITDPLDVEGNFTKVMNAISRIQDKLIKKGKLYLPQENSIGGKIPFENIVNQLIRIRQDSNKAKKFKIIFVNREDIYTAGVFNIELKTIQE
ncbi:MAG: DUF3084 domain-containing protein [bacterium]